MANPTWNDITSAPEWNDLSLDQRSAVRNKFYGDVIHPNIPDGVDPSAVQQQFAARTADSMKTNVGYGASIYRAVAGGLSDTDKFARTLGGAVPVAYDAAKSAITGTPTTDAQDSYFKGVVDPAAQYGMRQNIDPNTERQSAGPRIAGGLARTGTDIGMMMATGGESAIPRAEAGAGELIANGLGHAAQANLIPGTRNASDRAQQVLDQGGSGGQAALAAGADLATSTITNSVPLGMASGASNVATRFASRAATAAPVGAAGAIADNALTNMTNADGSRRNLTLGDIAEGAASTALLGGTMGGRKAPIDKGTDLQGGGNTAPLVEDPATHDITAGIPASVDSYRGHSVLRDSNGSPFAIAPQGGGDVTHLNGRSVDDVINAKQQMAPFTPQDQPGVVQPSGDNVVDSTATDVTPKQLTGPDAQLALSGPGAPNSAAVHVDSEGNPVPAPEGSANVSIADDARLPTKIGDGPQGYDSRWIETDPRDDPTAFGLDKPKRGAAPEKVEAFNQAVDAIEQQQAVAKAHVDVAQQNDVSPTTLATEVDRARQSNAADPTIGHGLDDPQANAHDHMEDLALHAGVDPMELNASHFGTNTPAEYTRAVAELIQARKGDGTDQGSTVRPAAENDSQAPVGAKPGDNGDAGNTGNDATAEAGAGSGVGEAPAAAVPAAADRSVASRTAAPASTRGIGASKAREAIIKRFGRAGSELLDSGKVQIHDSAATFPKGAQHLRSDDTVLQAVHDKANGITHIAADSVTEHNINGVVMHEVGVHHGMEGLLGNDRMSRLAGQLRVIGQTGKPAEKAMIAEALKNSNREGAGVRDEELIAHAVEQAEAAHAGGSLTPRLQVWLNDVLSTIKSKLYTMGMLDARRLNLNDIRHIAEGALLRVSRDKVDTTTKTGIDTDGRISSTKQSAEGNILGSRRESGRDERSGSGELRPADSEVQPGSTGSSDGERAGPDGPAVDAGDQSNVRELHEKTEGVHVDESTPVLSNREAYAFFKDQAPSFHKWFDDGKNIPQLRNADGSPVVYHHGSNDDLSSFDHGAAAKSGQSLARLGMWLTRGGDWSAHGPVDNSGFVRLKNPVEISADELNRAVDKAADRPEIHNDSDAVDYLKKEWQAQGHDGVVLTGEVPHVILFDANEGSFKSVDNNGDFSKDGDFRASRVGVNDDAAADNQKEKDPAAPAKETFRQAAVRKIGEMSHDLFLKVAPMADNKGSDEARAVSKDFANTLRMAGHEYDVADKALKDSLTPEERKQAWRAANEQSELMQQGLPTKGKGLDMLAPNVRAVVEHEQQRSQEALAAAVEAGIFDGTKGEGLPSYVPRMVIKRLVSGIAEKFGKGDPATRGDGANVRTNSPQLKERKYLLNKETEAAAKARDGDAEVVQDIRTLPLATKKLWEAVAGRKLINSIREVGQAIGQDMVRTDKPSGDEWFTLDHPAFTEYVRATESDPDNAGKLRTKLDVNHDPIFEPRQLFIHNSFEGPLKSIMSQKDGAIYRNLMELKTKTMTGIMISPAIHLMTEVGRALPAAPGKFLTGKIWSSGAAALRDEKVMHEAVMAGLAPIGGRGGNADVIELANDHNILPGKSLTAKILGGAVGLVNKGAGESVKRGIDTAGHFWHETLLWEQIRKLQAGLYVHFRDDAMKDGLSQDAASRIGAHFANRFAGTLPKEATSAMVRKTANLIMFSRTFTMGNWGVMKDAITGLPKDVQSQILRESGADGVARALSHSRRLAIGTLLLDTGLMYASNSLLQNAAAIYNGSTIQKELQGYSQRFYDLMSKIEKSPIEALNLIGDVSSLTPNSQNEAGKQDRILVGHKDDGTAIYVRNPFGKIGEEFTGWLGSPLEMAKRKLSTLARPASEIYTNDKGFGRKLYDPNADTVKEWGANARNIVGQIIGDQVNTSLIKDTAALFNGNTKDTTLNAAHLAGDLTGFTVSPGFPGGEAASELSHVKDKQEFKVQEAMPAVREKIKAGDVKGAVQDMSAMGVPLKLQEYYIKTTVNPAARLSAGQMQKFMQAASPDEKVRMMRDMSQRGTN